MTDKMYWAARFWFLCEQWKACASKLGRFLPMPPMFSFVRIRDIAANSRIIVDEHTAYAQSHLVVNASDNGALAVALVTRGVS
jgi:hypothetical protein